MAARDPASFVPPNESFTKATTLGGNWGGGGGAYCLSSSIFFLLHSFR